jgi:hypothetical protein
MIAQAFDGSIWWGGIIGLIVVFGPAWITYTLMSLISKAITASASNDSSSGDSSSSSDRGSEVTAEQPAAA